MAALKQALPWKSFQTAASRAVAPGLAARSREWAVIAL
jgi:hypothetical protein